MYGSTKGRGLIILQKKMHCVNFKKVLLMKPLKVQNNKDFLDIKIIILSECGFS